MLFSHLKSSYDLINGYKTFFNCFTVLFTKLETTQELIGYKKHSTHGLLNNYGY